MTFISIVTFIVIALLAIALIKFVTAKVYDHMKENLGNDNKLNDIAGWAAIGMIFCAMQFIVWVAQGITYVVHMLV